MIIAAKIIMGGILFYFIVFKILGFIGEVIMYKYNVKEQKKFPKAYPNPISKPTFLKQIKLKV
jgi:hypothetical protein